MKVTAETLYKSYPDSGMLSIDPPKPGETVAAYRSRIEKEGHFGDTLFLFVLRECADLQSGGDEECLRGIRQAISDLDAVASAINDCVISESLDKHAR